MTHNRRQVIAGASALAIGMTLDAHASPASSRSLIIVGDWGRDSAPHQRDVARQMDVVAGEMDCASVISVGDNFYEDGVQSVDDVKWRTSFEDIYSGPNLKSLPWYVALGNHDYGGVPRPRSTTPCKVIAGICRRAISRYRAPASACRKWICLLSTPRR